ncbi:MAG TPA: hypothetical protein VF799_03965 [Geobacteraceae bacterium]
MKIKRLLIFFSILTVITASPVFAHDHGGSHESMDHGAMKDPADDQNAKECAAVIGKCAQQVASIQRRILTLQAEIAIKHVGVSVREELKRLEQQLKEANETVRALQIM